MLRNAGVKRGISFDSSGRSKHKGNQGIKKHVHTGNERINMLADKWTEEEKEKAESIVNDTAEEIDNGESREELRKALRIYADLLYDAGVRQANERIERIME